jgi:hypothetical protein
LGGISSEFSSIPVTRRRYLDNERKNRDAQFAPKKARSPSRAGGRRARLQLTGKGRNHPPRRGSFSLGAIDEGRHLPPELGNGLGKITLVT